MRAVVALALVLGLALLGVAHAPPPSPETDVIHWAEHAVGQVLSRSMFANILKDNLSNGVILTTDFSGYGSGEIAMADLLDAFMQQTGAPAVDILSWRGCDIDRSRRQMLIAGKPPYRPLHVFGDIVAQRVDAPVRDKLRVAHALAKLRMHKLLKKNLADAKAVGVSESDRFLHTAIRIVKKHASFAFSRRAWCYSCRRMCLLHGPEWAQGSRVLRMNLAGTTCTAWSYMGKRRCWSAESTLSFVIWAHEQVALAVDIVIHECTVGFDVSTLMLIFGGAYICFTFVMCPTDLNRPASRPRRWTMLVRRSCFAVKLPLTLDNFKSFFALRLAEATADMLLRAPAALTDAMIEALALAKHLPPRTPEGLSWPWEQVLTTGDYMRLLGYLRWYRKRHIDPMAAKGVANIMQTVGFVGRPQSCVPTLLCSTSTLWSFLFRRLVASEERFEVMGIPVFDEGRDHDVYSGLERLWFQGVLDRIQLHAALGNGQVQSAIGCMILWCLCTLQIV